MLVRMMVQRYQLPTQMDLTNVSTRWSSKETVVHKLQLRHRRVSRKSRRVVSRLAVQTAKAVKLSLLRNSHNQRAPILILPHKDKP